MSPPSAVLEWRYFYFLKSPNANDVQVFVLSLSQYLETFWPHLPHALELLKTIKQAAASPEEGKTEGFFEYYKPELLEAGVRTGRLVQGRIAVNKHFSQTEAFVSRASKDSDKVGCFVFSNCCVDAHFHQVSGGDILIAGQEARNRAVDGDVVVVELLPKSEWKSKSTHLVLQEQEKDEGRSWSRGADVMPTGRVVGVVARQWRDYIATLARVEEDSMEKAAGKRVLVYPYDRRIPKIRILTTQSKALQGSRIVVRIDAWPVSSQYPQVITYSLEHLKNKQTREENLKLVRLLTYLVQGHFVKCLGRVGDLETEIDTILTENAIEVLPFSQGVLGEHITLEAAK